MRARVTMNPIENRMDVDMKTMGKWIRAGMALGVAAMAGTAFAAAPVLTPQQKAERERQETFWYGQGLVGQGRSGSQDLDVALGGGVALQGQASLGSGTVYSLAVGRQWLGGERDDDERTPWRGEVEYWSGSAKREQISLGALTVRPGDTVKASVLFLNGAGRIWETEERGKRTQVPLWRAWFGGGVGFGRVSIPDASALAPCNCLASASGSGAAFQVKLMVERQLSESAQLVLQAGRVWLPEVSTSSGAFPRTTWGTRSVDQLQVGLRFAFD